MLLLRYTKRIKCFIIKLQEFQDQKLLGQNLAIPYFYSAVYTIAEAFYG